MSRRLRVLHAIHDYLPRHAAGSEIYAAGLAAALARRGLHSAVLCAEFDPARPHGALSWRTHAGVPVVELINNWRAADLAGTWRDQELERALDHALDALQPDVLHVHSLLNLTLTLPARARRRGIPVVATLHDHTLVCPSGGQRVHRADHHVCRSLDLSRCARCFRESPFHERMRAARLAGSAGPLAARAAARLRRAVPFAATVASRALAHAPGTSVDAAAIEARLAAAREAWRHFDLVVSPSAALAAAFRDLGFPADPVVISDYGFEPVPRVSRTPRAGGPLRVGYAGTIVWHKGVDVLIDAMRLLPPGTAELLVFGDPGVFPDYTRDLRRRAAGLPVRFMGGYGRGELGDVFARIDVLAVPSRWMENSPLVIHEAFMAGVPVIGTRMGGIPELVATGRGGLLVDPDSPADLAAAIRRLADEPELGPALAAAAPPVKSMDEDAADWETRYRAALASRTRPVAAGSVA
ncbi:MAG TPA: glycosyltransferase [Vicinamibacterales bacterium]